MSSPLFQPSPGRLLLRPIETQESVGRIALLESTREKLTPNQYEVVEVGEAAVCEDDDCSRPHDGNHHSIPVRRGDWILVRHRAVVPTDVDPLVLAWQDDVIAVLQSGPPSD